ncbi:Hypothetical_protein [Hexamita inflata]|uniref:Hypothetical_protein n=1 Tax=Hexamita inflata TaxID=28002 RepID=A0AA86UW43_9EUKA|nr:Hypothetical protein HINF_LOCUS54737 [Hexamita inflata]
MPYLFEEDQEDLIITWTDQEDVQTQINMQDLSESYSSIRLHNVDYKDNSMLDQLLCRSQYLEFYDSKIHLPSFKGNWGKIQLNDCACTGDFQQCSISYLQISNCSIKLDQLLQLHDSNTLMLYYDQNCCFDLDSNKITNINCKFKSLSIQNQIIDLKYLNGIWDCVYLTNCTYNNELQPNALITNSMYIQQTNVYSLNAFKYLICNQISVQATSENLNSIFKANLKHLNKPEENLFKINNQGKFWFKIHLTNCICDLNSLGEFWDTVCFENCQLMGEFNQCNNLNMNIKINEQSKYEFDFTPLHNIKINLELELENVDMDLSQLKLCAPALIYLKNMRIDLQQMQNIKWNQIIFTNCNLANSDNLNANPILTNKVKLFKVNQQNFNMFQCDKISVSSCEIKALPESKNVNLHTSSLNLTQLSDQIEQLILTNCTYKKFSLLLFPNLIDIQVHSDVKNNNLKMFRNFIKCKTNIRTETSKLQTIFITKYNKSLNKIQQVNQLSKHLDLLNVQIKYILIGNE